jgi:NAD(P)-dependent dehydrogenase (short-subunit alcohol dehydrogenase family)
MFNLKGKVVVVAGGAGYLGTAVSNGLIRQGANLVIADLDINRAEHLVSKFQLNGGADRSHAYSLDVHNDNSIDEMIDRVLKDLGRVDVVVDTTYAQQGPRMEEMSSQAFTESLGSNIAGCFVLARKAKQVMKNPGSIIFFSSMYGSVAPDPRVYHEPMPPNPLEYGIAKAGIEQMIRYLAVAWAKDGIRVNGIAPGPFPNPDIQQAHPEFVKRLANRVPLGRIGQAEEIAGAVVFLASDEATYITGHILAIDGGWTAW